MTRTNAAASGTPVVRRGGLQPASAERQRRSRLLPQAIAPQHAADAAAGSAPRAFDRHQNEGLHPLPWERTEVGQRGSIAPLRRRLGCVVVGGEGLARLLRRTAQVTDAVEAGARGLED